MKKESGNSASIKAVIASDICYGLFRMSANSRKASI